VHYAAIRQPRAAEVFIADLQARLHAGLDRLDQAVRTNTAGGVRITTRRGRPWIVVPAMGLPQAATGRSPLEGLSMWVPTGQRPGTLG
jgi:hypothetical protein